MVTLCTTCRPFEGRNGLIQTNALESWARLGSAVDVVLIGDEPGVPQIAQRLGFRHAPKVARNEHGTPLVSDLLDVARQEARGPLVGWVNSDIMLTPSLLPAIETTRRRFERFLLIARRWNVRLDEPWRFDTPDWPERLAAHARSHGSLEAAFGGMDLFVYPGSTAWELPPYAIGRGRWDSALVLRARQLGMPVVDATEVVTSVHQEHDYEHIEGSGGSTLAGPEWDRNQSLLGGDAFVATALNATHRLTASGLRRQWTLRPALLARQLAAAPALHPSLRPLAPAVARLAPLWRGLRHRGVRRARRSGASASVPPVDLPRRPASRALPPGGGVENFESPNARAINRARMKHLLGLGLPLRGRSVLEAGCGPGHLGQSLVEAGCKVTSVDAREANIERLRGLYPGRKAHVFDLERDDPESLGRFDVVFAYGILYHVENPVLALRRFAGLARECVLVETQVADHPQPLAVYEEETSSFSQALRNLATRPSPSLVALALRDSGFPYVYAPAEPPEHPDYRFDWKGDLATSRAGALLRCVFVAAREPLQNTQLVDLLSP